MAEITQNNRPEKNSEVRSHKMSTHIDFTPMVDLGFLLITFFMLTTSLMKNQIMPISMPDRDTDDPDKINPEMAITLILGSQDKVYYYEGIEAPQLDSTDVSSNGLRKVLLDKRQRIHAKFGLREMLRSGVEQEQSKMIVLVKPMKDSRYKNVVDVFDELEICDIPGRVLLDISQQEIAFVQHPNQGLSFSVAEQRVAAKRDE